MTAFRVGDKVTHPLTGDNVLTVCYSFNRDRHLQVRCDTVSAEVLLEAPAAEFTAYVPPRVSTDALKHRLESAWGAADYRELASIQALAEAATALAERLEEESR